MELGVGSELFFEFPGATARVLYRGAVTKTDMLSVRARFRDPAIHAKPGSEVRVYYMRDERFAMQFADVVDVDDWISTDDQITTEITVQMVGMAVPSERRESLRVSAYGSDLIAEFAGERDCTVPDISECGLSVIAKGRHQVGAHVDIELRTGGETLTGRGSIQNARLLPNGMTRYGVFVIKSLRSTLGRSMGRITEALRQQQLKALDVRS